MDFLKRKDIPLVTIILVAVNVIIFLYMDFTGNTRDTMYLYEHGAMEVSAVLDHGEWYRVLTHMFMHSGIEHLGNNMLMLGVVGYTIENIYGRWKYLISYFICGICATIFSAAYDIYTNQYPVGVGASGAIMGIFGIYIMMSVKSKMEDGIGDPIRLLVLMALMIFGNMQEGVDWMAHLGGGLTGLVLGLLLYRPKKRDNTSMKYYPYE